MASLMASPLESGNAATLQYLQSCVARDALSELQTACLADAYRLGQQASPATTLNNFAAAYSYNSAGPAAYRQQHGFNAHGHNAQVNQRGQWADNGRQVSRGVLPGVGGPRNVADFAPQHHHNAPRAISAQHPHVLPAAPAYSKAKWSAMPTAPGRLDTPATNWDRRPAAARPPAPRHPQQQQQQLFHQSHAQPQQQYQQYRGAAALVAPQWADAGSWSPRHQGALQNPAAAPQQQQLRAGTGVFVPLSGVPSVSTPKGSPKSSSSSQSSTIDIVDLLPEDWEY